MRSAPSASPWRWRRSFRPWPTTPRRPSANVRAARRSPDREPDVVPIIPRQVGVRDHRQRGGYVGGVRRAQVVGSSVRPCRSLPGSFTENRQRFGKIDLVVRLAADVAKTRRALAMPRPRPPHRMHKRDRRCVRAGHLCRQCAKLAQTLMIRLFFSLVPSDANGGEAFLQFRRYRRLSTHRRTS